MWLQIYWRMKLVSECDILWGELVSVIITCFEELCELAGLPGSWFIKVKHSVFTLLWVQYNQYFPSLYITLNTLHRIKLRSLKATVPSYCDFTMLPWSIMCIELVAWIPVHYSAAFIVFKLLWVQYDHYFPSFSFVANLFHEPLGKWNNSKMNMTKPP